MLKDCRISHIQSVILLKARALKIWMLGRLFLVCFFLRHSCFIRSDSLISKPKTGPRHVSKFRLEILEEVGMACLSLARGDD